MKLDLEPAETGTETGNWTRKCNCNWMQLELDKTGTQWNWNWNWNSSFFGMTKRNRMHVLANHVAALKAQHHDDVTVHNHGRHMENIHVMAEAPTRTAPHSAASRVSVAIGKITDDSQPTK